MLVEEQEKAPFARHQARNELHRRPRFPLDGGSGAILAAMGRPCDAGRSPGAPAVDTLDPASAGRSRGTSPDPARSSRGFGRSLLESVICGASGAEESTSVNGYVTAGSNTWTPRPQPRSRALLLLVDADGPADLAGHLRDRRHRACATWCRLRTTLPARARCTCGCARGGRFTAAGWLCFELEGVDIATQVGVPDGPQRRRVVPPQPVLAYGSHPADRRWLDRGGFELAGPGCNRAGLGQFLRSEFDGSGTGACCRSPSTSGTSVANGWGPVPVVSNATASATRLEQQRDRETPTLQAW